MRIALDYDGVISDLHRTWMEMYNTRCCLSGSECVSISDVKEWSIHKTMNRMDKSEVYGMLDHPGIFYFSKPLPGLFSAIQQLVDDGHDIYIITSAPQKTAFYEKVTWVKDNLDIMFSEDKRLSDRMFAVSKGTLKHLILHDFDVIVDDYPVNMNKANGSFRILMDAPYNRSEEYEGMYDRRAKSWQEIVTVIKKRNNQE